MDTMPKSRTSPIAAQKVLTKTDVKNLVFNSALLLYYLLPPNYGTGYKLYYILLYSIISSSLSVLVGYGRYRLCWPNLASVRRLWI
jgi:hypothetical protein